ncbi:hypothetical protein SAMN05216548_11335 [Faunimonas pinastri]|uniref:Uncharacterized protein n=1 Tax=Faunimonas pinastri TaxID=1855383 RepID=A0A1H9MBC4_9HYPH|nr:hypothetical protein [Faunimonas pinastri]SER20735.1 hypothetical protein SAMN05216548_11335 [Faunimonas pinastri]
MSRQTLPMLAMDVAVGLLLLVVAAAPFLLWSDVSNFRENGPAEGPQSIFLLCATVFFLFTLARSHRLTRLEIAGISLFCFNLFIRETDIRHTWAEPILGSHFTKQAFVVLAVAWLVVVGFSLLRFKQTATDLLRWLISPAGILMIAGLLLYLSGDRAEKHGFFPDADRSESLEESLELYGSFVIFLSGYVWFRLSAPAARTAAVTGDLRTAGQH